MTDVTPFLTRVVLKNYKSIAASGVDLRALTFLVGPNGSGKSNFLDALRFTSDSLRSSLDNALLFLKPPRQLQIGFHNLIPPSESRADSADAPYRQPRGPAAHFRFPRILNHRA